MFEFQSTNENQNESKLESLTDQIEECRHMIRFAKIPPVFTDTSGWTDTHYFDYWEPLISIRKSVAQLSEDFAFEITDKTSLNEIEYDVQQRLLLLHNEAATLFTTILNNLTNHLTQFPAPSTSTDNIDHVVSMRSSQAVGQTCNLLTLVSEEKYQVLADQILEMFAETHRHDIFSRYLLKYASVSLQTKFLQNEFHHLLADDSTTLPNTPLNELIKYMRIWSDEEEFANTYEAIKQALTREIGQNGMRLVESWLTSAQESGYVARELERFIFIWQRYGHEKALRLIQQYGITNFASIPLPALDAQADFAENGQVDKKIIAVILPFSDYNGALRHHEQLFLDLFNNTKETHNLAFAQVKHRYEVLRRLSRIKKDYGSEANKEKIDHLIIGVHGKTNELHFGPQNTDILKIDDIFGRSGIAHATLSEDSEIILISCSTGAENGIGEKISTTAQKTVHAPKIPTNIKHITSTYNKDHRLILTPIYTDAESGRVLKPAKPTS